MSEGEIVEAGAHLDIGRMDRRSNRRYRIDAAVCYRVFSRNKLVGMGYGRTLNISIGGILFTSAHAVPPRRKIELAVAWPVHFDNTKVLVLWGTGVTVRPRGGCTAVKVTHYDLRVGTPGEESPDRGPESNVLG